MYSHLRNDFILSLTKNFNTSEITMILASLDACIENYEISKRCTDIVTYEQDERIELIKLYLATKKIAGCSDGTIKLYGGRLKIFLEMVDKKFEEISANDIRMFLVRFKNREGREDGHVSDRTLDKVRQILSDFFQWCVNEDYLIKNPCKNIPNIKFIPKPRKALTRMELEKLRRACKNERDLAMIDMLYSTGCRVAELAKMKFSDINWETKTVHIIGKGGKHNDCPLNANALLSLEEYAKTRKGDSDYIFVKSRKPYLPISREAIEDRFRVLTELIDCKVVPHTIRHTTATLAYENGMNIECIQKLLGHSNISTTQIYAEISDAEVINAHKKYIV